VRIQALFSLGNLAYGLRAVNKTELLVLPTLVEVCTIIHRALDDTNDKVTGNAIRSIGHWGYLLASCNLKDETAESSESLCFILDSLSQKVSRTFALASNAERGGLSWKQRSVAKKHGWGACHSLSQLFQAFSVLEDQSLITSCSGAVRQLIACVEKLSLLSEKVAVSAMAALRDLKPLQLAAVTGKSGMVGEALASCSVRLYYADTQQNSVSPKVLGESQLLLQHLLASASISDATVALKRDDFSRSVLDFFYTWMVENDVDGRAFEIFAMALQRPGLILSSDVSLEQNFASRALQQYKKNQSLTLTNDDADEL
jgi:hypothetical protein